MPTDQFGFAAAIQTDHLTDADIEKVAAIFDGKPEYDIEPGRYDVSIPVTVMIEDGEVLGAYVDFDGVTNDFRDNVFDLAAERWVGGFVDDPTGAASEQAIDWLADQLRKVEEDE